MPRSSILMFLLASTALTGPAFAQDEDSTDLGTLRIETLDAQTALGNVEVTSEEIEQRNPVSMRDVFTSETAATTSGGADIGQRVFVHGIEESLLSVTIDGARQNKSAFHHTGHVVIDPALLKSVEISSGLAPADAGPGAMAGSIAYQTKDARDLLEPGANIGGMLTFGMDSNGADGRGTLTLYGAAGGFDYLLSGTRVTGSDYRDGSGTTVPGSGPELSSYMAKLSYTLPQGHRIAFSASETTDDGLRASQFHGGLGVYFARPDFFGIGGGTPTVLMEAVSQRKSYTLTYTHDGAGSMFAPEVQLAYNEQLTDVIGVWGKNKSLSGVIKNEFALGNGTLTTGIDFFDESAEGYSRSAVNLGYLGSEKHRGIGLFAQARQDFGHRMSVSYGARLDAQEFTGADGSEFQDNGVSVNAAIDYELTDTLTLNAGLASSWGGYELGEAALINLSAPWTYTGLKTSRATSGRIGLRFDNGPWQISGALFQTEAKDLSAVLPARPANSRAATTDITTRGIDMSVGYQWDNGFARLNYTYAEVTEAGSAVSSTRYYYGRPMGHMFGLELGWQANDELRLGATAEIALKNDDVATGEAPLQPYEVLNLYAEYQPKELSNLKIRFDVRNVFNETYVRRGADISSRAIDLTEPGRNIALTGTLRF